MNMKHSHSGRAWTQAPPVAQTSFPSSPPSSTSYEKT
jgi:hypothetical protein